MKRTLTMAALAAALLLGVGTPTYAATPKITFHCGPPIHTTVTCLLSGRGFRPHERLHISYRITLAPGDTRLYRRDTVADDVGSFTRPPLRFSGGHHGIFLYRATVAVWGTRGDYTSTEEIGEP